MTPIQTATTVNVVAGAVVGAAFGYAYFINKKLERETKKLHESIAHNAMQMSIWVPGQPLILVH